DRAGEQSLNPFVRLFSLVLTDDVGIASVIPDARLTDFLEKLALQADFEPREGAIWFDRDEVKSAIPIDGQRMQIENSRDAVLEHWLDEGGVDLPVDYTPTETDADQVRALIRDIAEPAAEQDLTLLASRMRDDGTEPPLMTVTTRPHAHPAQVRDRPASSDTDLHITSERAPIPGTGHAGVARAGDRDGRPREPRGRPGDVPERAHRRVPDLRPRGR